MIVIILLFLVGIANAETIVSTTYLVYPDSFTQVDFDTLKSYQHKTDLKGFKNTQLLQAMNTNYYILEITTRNTIENNAIQTALNAGKLFKMATRQCEKRFDDRAGREVINISEFWYHRPKEITDAFKVEVTTP